MSKFRLISSDSHVTMPDEAWQEYLDPEFRDRAPRIEQTDDGDVRIFEGQRTPVQGLSNLAGKRPEDFSLNVRSLQETRAMGPGFRRTGSRTWISTGWTPRSCISAAP